jgi:5-methylthioadenosine/S-adenosylhomocysteine deaminase
MSIRHALACALLVASVSFALAFAQGPREVALVIANGTVVTMDASRRTIPGGAVAVDAGAIVAVGDARSIEAAYRGRERIDAAGGVILPGLVNTHTHAPMVLYRGLADDLALMEWLQKYIFPAEARTVSPGFVAAGTRLALLEMIKSGTTTFVDMYYFEEEVARAARSAGMRGVLGQTIIQFPVADARTPAEGLARAERFIGEFEHDPLITPAVAPHSMYTLAAEDLRACRALADGRGAPLLIHLAETEDEVKIAREKHSRTPTGYLESLGLFSSRTLGAHGVWLTPEDIGILRRRGVGIAHNPESNMKLASGVAPVPALRAAGVAVGLGTDGAASNNDLDMFEAVRQAALLHKLESRDPRTLPAVDALAMATIEGARSLGMQDRVGSIEAGKRADLIVVDLTSARQTPVYDPVSHLVYATRGDDVRTSVIDGKVVMRDRRVLTLDEAGVLAEARKIAGAVRAAVGQR